MIPPGEIVQISTHKGAKLLTEYANSMLASGLAASTVKLRIYHIERFRLTHPDLVQVTTVQLQDYLARTHGLAPESRKAILSSLRKFFHWAHRMGHIDNDPTLMLDSIRIPRVIPRLAPDDDIQVALISATEHEQGMILLGRLACLRLTELSTLHVRNRERDLLRITGKGGKQRMVPINDDLMPILLTLERINGGGYYFPGRYGGHMHPQSVNKIITRRTGWNPHSLRHAGATAAYRATGDLRAVQEFLGHSSLATTERYLHVGLDEVRRVGQGTSMKSTARSAHYPDFVPHAA